MRGSRLGGELTRVNGEGGCTLLIRSILYDFGPLVKSVLARLSIKLLQDTITNVPIGNRVASNVDRNPTLQFNVTSSLGVLHDRVNAEKIEFAGNWGVVRNA